MDRLLLKLLHKVIRRGNLQITTASGSTLVVGDGSGTPVAIRFATYAAEWGGPNRS